MTILTCVCGSQFDRPYYKFVEGKKSFCSRACSNRNGQRFRRRVERIKCTCACGTEFLMTQVYLDQGYGKACSRLCASKIPHPRPSGFGNFDNYISENRGHTTPCWIWQGADDGGRYGRIFDRGQTRSAHRVSYERRVGPIPDGLEIDHLCRVKMCINPAHLEPVTPLENQRRKHEYNRANKAASC